MKLAKNLEETKKPKWELSYEEFYASQIGYYEKIATHVNDFSTKNKKNAENSMAKKLLDEDYKKFQDLKHRFSNH